MNTKKHTLKHSESRVLPFGETGAGKGLKIYHNPRCRKSREGLQILEASGQEFEIIKYLDTVPTESQLSEIINLLGISPIQLVRKTEKIWKENYKEKDLTDAELIAVMIANPRLIERPIVVHKNKAVIGRPPSNILEIL